MGDVSLLRNEGSSTSTPQIVTIQSDNSPSLPAAFFQKNDHRSPIHMHCTVNMTDRHIELDRLRVRLFLAGLDPEFDQVGGKSYA
ncbi:hypothetical protein L3X38_038411 [Prunus dulcis]|uniref:Uncharacterized protein n=1 Tax=Prunus dulcis TaxID=3755 RepID=A0AAD4V6A3_PRUDU|nr:hypothetical protein L3X38_038411 [Prunus dulcis]